MLRIHYCVYVLNSCCCFQLLLGKSTDAMDNDDESVSLNGCAEGRTGMLCEYCSNGQGFVRGNNFFCLGKNILKKKQLKYFCFILKNTKQLKYFFNLYIVPGGCVKCSETNWGFVSLALLVVWGVSLFFHHSVLGNSSLLKILGYYTQVWKNFEKKSDFY